MELQYASLGLICALDSRWAFALIDLGAVGVYGIRLGPLRVFIAVGHVGDYRQIDL